jgi:hypothetical protein
LTPLPLLVSPTGHGVDCSAFSWPSIARSTMEYDPAESSANATYVRPPDCTAAGCL